MFLLPQFWNSKTKITMERVVWQKSKQCTIYLRFLLQTEISTPDNILLANLSCSFFLFVFKYGLYWQGYDKIDFCENCYLIPSIQNHSSRWNWESNDTKGENLSNQMNYWEKNNISILFVQFYQGKYTWDTIFVETFSGHHYSSGDLPSHFWFFWMPQRRPMGAIP